jgi:hypothetical protein
VTSQNLTVTGAGQTDTLPLALSQIRESDSVVQGPQRPGHRDRRPDDHTEIEHQLSRRPPRIDPAPRQSVQEQADHDTKTELVILLKPIVVGRRRGRMEAGW